MLTAFASWPFRAQNGFIATKKQTKKKRNLIYRAISSFTLICTSECEMLCNAIQQIRELSDCRKTNRPIVVSAKAK